MDYTVRCHSNTDLKCGLCFKNPEGSQVKWCPAYRVHRETADSKPPCLASHGFSLAKYKKQVPCPTYLFLKLMFSGLNTSWYAALLPRMRSNRWTASTTALQGNTERSVSEWELSGIISRDPGCLHRTVPA